MPVNTLKQIQENDFNRRISKARKEADRLYELNLLEDAEMVETLIDLAIIGFECTK